MSNAIVELRNKYAEDLEEILQCPVCYEFLRGTVPQCAQGHHFCLPCQQKMQECPFCKGDFLGARNFLAENLLNKFDDIKVSLIDPKHSSNFKTSNKVCIETQTDSEIVRNGYKNPPAVGKGVYPCKIGNCLEELPHGRMLPHIRYYHNDCVMMENVVENSYESSWILTYTIPSNFDRAINIPNMGLFFLNIHITSEGTLYGRVVLVNSRLTAQQFNYTLEVTNRQSSISYKGGVISCRSAKDKFSEKGLLVNSLTMEYLVGKKLLFKSNLTLNRLPENS